MEKIKYLKMVLPVRYGEEDMPLFMPFRKGDSFEITYAVETGDILDFDNLTVEIDRIIQWNQENCRVSEELLVEKSIFKLGNLKVVDEGCYYLLDKDMHTLYDLDQEYVPDSHSVDGKYGDYIHLHLDLKNGKLLNFKKDATFKEFLDQD